MQEGRVVKVLADLSTEEFFGRERELESLARHATGHAGGKTLLLLSAPGTERSQLLKHTYDQLFTGQDEIVPFYFSISDHDKNAREIAARFAYEFVLQTVAFRWRNPGILYSSPEIFELSDVADSKDANWISRVADMFSRESSAGNDAIFLRSCFGVPHRAAAERARPFAMIDSLHRLAYLDDGADIIAAIRNAFDKSEIRLVLAGHRRYLSGRMPGESVHLERLPFEDAGLLVESIAARYSVPLNEQTRDLIAVQFDGNRTFIDAILLAARKKGESVESFQKVQHIYAEELFGGAISRYFDRLFQKIAPTSSIRTTLLMLLNEPPENRSFTEWQSALGYSDSEISHILELLNINEIVRLSSSRVEVMTENRILTDYISTRSRLNLAGENRALVYAESLAAFLKRAPQTMAGAYRNRASLDIRQILKSFNAKRIPQALVDYGLFAGRYKGLADDEILGSMQSDPETFALPRIVYTTQASSIYKPLEQVASGPRSAVAFGFEGNKFTDDGEVGWIAAEIDSKLEASRDVAEFWCDRLEMAAVHSNFKNYKLWLVAPEGFTAEALGLLRQRNCFGSSARQARLLSRFLSSEPDSAEQPGGRVYEMVLPMDDEAELIAAHSVEEIAKRHNFGSTAINQIKTALVEAYINASEHSLSPDRKIRQRIAVSDDRITITVANRGLRLTDRAAASLDNGEEQRRGWGLKLIQKLMDEVTVEPTDDGTSITMTKLKRSEPPA